MKILSLPKLSDFDKTSPDYAAWLDDSIKRIESALEGYSRVYKKNTITHSKELCNKLNSLDGVLAIPIDRDKILDFGGLELVAGIRVTGSTPFTIEKKRAIEDLVTNARRAQEDETRKYQDAKTPANRAYADFIGVVGELTEFNEIIGITPNTKTLHIYAASNGEVYESHTTIGEESSNSGIAINPNLTAKNLKDEQVIAKFKEASTGKDAAVYFVSNPCKSATPEGMIINTYLHVLDKHIEKICSYCKQKIQENEKDPTSAWVDSLNKNI
jgi:hypothetical protein